MLRLATVAGLLALSCSALAQHGFYEGLSYGDSDQQKIDLWVADTDEPAPLVIFIHGGGFRNGSRKQANPRVAQAFLRQGISFASIDYRLTDKGPYPMQMNDAARALQWLRHNAEKYNIDKTRVAAYGGSAGACISMWLAFHDDMADPGSDDPVARESTRLTVAGSQNGQPTLDPRTFYKWFEVKTLRPSAALYPLFNITSYADTDKPEVRKLVEDASPITHLDKNDVPVYLVYRGADTKVTETTQDGVWVHHPRLGIKLKEQMDKLGIECHVQYPNGPRIENYRSLTDFLIKKLKGRKDFEVWCD